MILPKIIQPRTHAPAVFAVFLCLLLQPSPGLSADTIEHTGWGSIRGQFLFEGEIPQRRVLIRKGSTTKDAEVCAAQTTYADDLLIDSKSRGIANVVVYLKTLPPQRIHPELRASKKRNQRLTVSGCRFQPHVLFVRTDQTLVFDSKDTSIQHAFAAHPLQNLFPSYLVRPNEHELAFKQREFCPFQVTCRIHSSMSAWVLVLDHPYQAITSADGRFQIDRLPAGKHQFRIWHERVGYVQSKWTVEVAAEGVTTLEPLRLTLKQLTREKAVQGEQKTPSPQDSARKQESKDEFIRPR